VKRLLRASLGILFLILGLAGLVLPILQGWLFLTLGVLFLAPDISIFARIVNWVETLFPAVKDPVRRIRQFLGQPETH
jgi:uncharacterized protein